MRLSIIPVIFFRPNRMESDNETDFLAPPTPVVSARGSAIHNVPFFTTGLLLFTGLVSIILCIIWITVASVPVYGLNFSNGTWHFLLMTLFVIFTGIGATAFRIFTFLPRPLAKDRGYNLIFLFMEYINYSINLTFLNFQFQPRQIWSNLKRVFFSNL